MEERKKVCFITGTRADYGILAPIMKKVRESGKAELQIIATNMHLSPEYGETVKEIEADVFENIVRIESLVEGGTSAATVRSMANVETGLADAFEELNPDLVVILGDRYEALAAASAAVVFNIPVVHLHGGETTEGAIDNKFRHAITQLSDYHFAATPQYVDKIISMGVSPDKVFHSGAPGAEIRDFDDPSLPQEFLDKTGINPYERFILLAFHPVTLAEDKGKSELEATLEALESFISQGYKILVTMPNSDPGTNEISSLLEDFANRHSETVKAVKSLGARLFGFAMEMAAVMVGNSSAALIEAPSHRLPAVNVGIRQKGRVHGITVLDVPGDAEKIRKAIESVVLMEMKTVLLGMTVGSLNPYYKKEAANFIANTIL